MRKIIAFISAIVSLSLFASCEKDINVKVPPYQSKLTVFSNSGVGEPIIVNIGKSLSIANRKNNPDLTVTNASVQLFEDGVLKQNLVYEEALRGYSSTVFAQVGKTYTVKVTAPNFPDAASVAVAPSEVPIKEFARIPNARNDENGNSQDALVLTFDDPVTTGDYYIIKVMQALDSFSSSSFCVNSADASIETPANENVDFTTCLDNNNIFLRDELFNGKQKQIKLYVDPGSVHYSVNGADTTFPYIQLLHVSEAYFRFEKSRRAADDANGDPFSEPVNVYTNVTNGYGVLSIVSHDEVLIK